MIAYWGLFLLSLVPERLGPLTGRLFWALAFASLVLVVGYRFEVGCDWEQYYFIFQLSQSGFSRATSLIDPGYGLLNWAVGELGGGVVHVNLVAATFFVSGLLVFVRHQPLPVLALAIAVPYMTIVVAMGYTRQAIALGFLMIALTRLGSGRNIAFFLLVLAGALFHKTAVVMLPLGVIGLAKGRGLTNYLVLAFSIWIGGVLILDSAGALWENYVDAQMESQGALIRVAMNLVAAVTFLLVRKQWNRRYDDGYLWVWIAWACVACVPLVQFSTTAVDRIALYFLPMQVIVFSRLPVLFSTREVRQLVGLGVLAGYGLVLFVWLNYAAHANCWLPYKSALF